jgi:hypothetical protein
MDHNLTMKILRRREFALWESFFITNPQGFLGFRTLRKPPMPPSSRGPNTNAVFGARGFVPRSSRSARVPAKGSDVKGEARRQTPTVGTKGMPPRENPSGSRKRRANPGRRSFMPWVLTEHHASLKTNLFSSRIRKAFSSFGPIENNYGTDLHNILPNDFTVIPYTFENPFSSRIREASFGFQILRK